MDFYEDDYYIRRYNRIKRQIFQYLVMDRNCSIDISLMSGFTIGMIKNWQFGKSLELEPSVLVEK